MTEPLIAAIERLGHAVEHGADRGAAIRELCAIVSPTLAALLDNWRDVCRHHYELKGATRTQFDELWAVVEAARARDGGD